MMIADQFQVIHAHAAVEFSVEKKLGAKLLISWGRLWHENVLIGDFRVSDVPMPAASGNMVKTGTATEFQAASGVTRLRMVVTTCRRKWRRWSKMTTSGHE